MKINRHLLPVKAHFFFFMAAMGPILPQLSVFGKELGISPVVMGSVTGILPIAFLLAKPGFGMMVDVYRNYRKLIFMCLIVIMTVSYAALNFIPAREMLKLDFKDLDPLSMDTCNVTEMELETKCDKSSVKMSCTTSSVGSSEPIMSFLAFKGPSEGKENITEMYRLCQLPSQKYLVPSNITSSPLLRNFTCSEDTETGNNACLYKTLTFWGFVLLMSIGTIGFNVVNSISDAICFDVIGEKYDYGKQRVWGTIGFGLTALIAGYVVDIFSGSSISYAPAIIVMLIFSILDLLACINLKLPIIESPKNILKDLKDLMNTRYVVIFMIFSVCAGIVDSFIIYFLFWYLEDLATSTNTTNIKLIEGLIVAAETLGGEVIFFSVSGKILERFGHVYCFSMCFINYALRLGLISVAPSPWWILPIEFCMQGPTYALTYTTIVAYANELAPPGASATMQGIAAGMDDGVGYAIGSVIGGLLYRYLGGRHALQVFSAFGLFCSLAHFLLHKVFLPGEHNKGLTATTTNGGVVVEYRNPEEAVKTTYNDVDEKYIISDVNKTV